MSKAFVCTLLFCFYLYTQDAITTKSSLKWIALPSDKVDSTELWQARVESERKLLSERMGYLEKVVLQSKAREEKVLKEKTDLSGEVAQLRTQLQTLQTREISTYPMGEVLGTDDDPFQDERKKSKDLVLARAPLRESVMEQNSDKIKNVQKTIPSGTTVQALLVSSIDASCGINSQANPQTLKLRILDDARLPSEVRVKIKRGLVIATAYGDLSSERVFVRIERLTLVRPNGDFMETGVTGFVTGEDGKNGVRGVVVDRSDKLLSAAAASGFFSGRTSYLIATASAFKGVGHHHGEHKEQSPLDIFKAGSYAGGTSALDQLSQYYVKRAEQLQPVIQVAAGRLVDITFTHGAEFGDLDTKENLKEIRESTRES
jgi:conjugal transfer pilus assembly protein TraB